MTHKTCLGKTECSLGIYHKFEARASIRHRIKRAGSRQPPHVFLIPAANFRIVAHSEIAICGPSTLAPGHYNCFRLMSDSQAHSLIPDGTTPSLICQSSAFESVSRILRVAHISWDRGSEEPSILLPATDS
ncbi:MAG: hypothetical protein Q8P46_10370 [Hyphomicrobiales bacterium]|nr:hypothetical protein [Hyphomicrobiales bacterium]